MAFYTMSPTSLTFEVNMDGPPHQVTKQLTVSDDDATLAKVNSAAWLTIPASSTDGVAFNVTVDSRDIPKGAYRRGHKLTETIRASGGLETTDLTVTLKIRPGGKPKS